MIGNSHQPRQQSYEDADEIQAGIKQFQRAILYTKTSKFKQYNTECEA